MAAHHRAASENVLTSSYYFPTSPSAANHPISFALSDPDPPASPSTAVPKARRPSISNAINWLSNAPVIQHMREAKTVVISPPTLITPAGHVERFGKLGEGATVVTSAQEAMLPSRKERHTPSPSLNNIDIGRGNAYLLKEQGGPYPPRHHRSGSRPYLPHNAEDLPPLPASPAFPAADLPPPRRSQERPTRDGLMSRGSSHGRKSDDDPTSTRSSSSGRRTGTTIPAQPPAPTSALPTPPNASPLNNPMKLRDGDSSPSRSGPNSTIFPPSVAQSAREYVPRRRSPPPAVLPPDLLLSASPQPVFSAIVTAPLPVHLYRDDPAKVLVSLQTCTESYKTTLQTLLTRPSHLATHLIHLITSTSPPAATAAAPVLPPLKSPTSPNAPAGGEDEDVKSVYSERSEFYDSDVDAAGAGAGTGKDGLGFAALFQDHLRGRKQRPGAKDVSPPVVHLFLDRPSSAYAHILTYLRAPQVPTANASGVDGEAVTAPGVLPTAVRIFSPRSYSRARLESLLELRDEATYLGLLDLADLCAAELATASRTSLSSSTSQQAERTSLHSTHTLCEPDERVTFASDAITKGLNAPYYSHYTHQQQHHKVSPEFREAALPPPSEERAQAALHVRRHNANAGGYEEAVVQHVQQQQQQQHDQRQHQQQAMVPPPPPLQRETSYGGYGRQVKSLSPSRKRRAAEPPRPDGNYF